MFNLERERICSLKFSKFEKNGIFANPGTKNIKKGLGHTIKFFR